jgi:hypothetical protein
VYAPAADHDVDRIADVAISQALRCDAVLDDFLASLQLTD